MTGDASLPPQAPLTNGMAPLPGHGEVDASSLKDVCADFHGRVAAFLAAPAKDETTRRTQEQTKISLGVIAEALNKYTFEELSLSYNGGKDCLVLLILYLSVLHTHFTQPTNRRKQSDADVDEYFPTTIPSVYVKAPDPFPEVTHFVDISTKAYHLSLTHLTTYYGPNPTSLEKSHSNPPVPGSFKHIPRRASVEPQLSAQADTNTNDPSIPSQQPILKTEPTLPIITFRDAFTLYLAANPNIKAIFVGTRRTDPHGGHLTHFDRTDHKWPDFMRIHPVIDWRLSEIWTFLRSPYLENPVIGNSAKVSSERENPRIDQGIDVSARTLPAGGVMRSGIEYCSMYDMGYTSLGGINDTLKNPKLKYIDKDGCEKYRPAFELLEDLEERLGRE